MHPKLDIFVKCNVNSSFFNDKQLKPVTPNPISNQTQSPPPPIEVDGKEEYKVAKNLDSKMDKHYQCCAFQYYVC